MASRMRTSSSSMVSAAPTQPGRSGTYAAKFVPASSMMMGYSVIFSASLAPLAARYLPERRRGDPCSESLQRSPYLVWTRDETDNDYPSVAPDANHHVPVP